MAKAQTQSPKSNVFNATDLELAETAGARVGSARRIMYFEAAVE
jgi:hypothetical protein